MKDRHHILNDHTNWWDRVITLYAAAFIIYRLLDLLTPFHFLFEQPGFSMVTNLLGAAGGALLVIDFITVRNVMRAEHVRWIILLLMALSLSAAVRYQYNDPLDFIKYIIYVSAQDLLLFSAGLCLSRKGKYLFMKWLYTASSIVFIPALCYMLWQFLSQQYYLNSDAGAQGWFEGRLFGIMYTLYDGSLAVSMLAFGAAWLLISSKSPYEKFLYAAELTIYAVYISLSDCRTAYAAIAAGIGVIQFYKCCIDCQMDRERQKIIIIKKLLIYVIALVMMFAGIGIIRSAGLYLAWDISGTEESYSQYRAEKDRPEQYSVSSGRTEIWKTYFRILTDKPSHLIFGLSYNGHAKYIREHYPDTFIVTYFKEKYPLSYSKGNVYDAHNAYLFTIVTSGIMGFAALLGFLINCTYDVVNRTLKANMTDQEALLAAVIAMLLTAGMFEKNTFIPVSFIAGSFWMTAGFLMNTGKMENA